MICKRRFIPRQVHLQTGHVGDFDHAVAVDVSQCESLTGQKLQIGKVSLDGGHVADIDDAVEVYVAGKRGDEGDAAVFVCGFIEEIGVLAESVASRKPMSEIVDIGDRHSVGIIFIGNVKADVGRAAVVEVEKFSFVHIVVGHFNFTCRRIAADRTAIVIYFTGICSYGAVFIILYNTSGGVCINRAVVGFNDSVNSVADIVAVCSYRAVVDANSSVAPFVAV